MKILNDNNISFVTQSNSNKKLSRRERESDNTNVIKISNKDNKSKESNFLNSIINRNKDMQERITDVKLKDFKHLLKLEEQKDNVVKSIKDICKDNKDKLSQWNGISSDLNDILSGNVDSVLENMNFTNVDNHISNLEIGVVFDDLSDLKKYYGDGLDSSISFIDYRNSKGENSTFNPNDLSDSHKGDYSLLETLKDSYKNLFRIDEAIKNFKKDSNERLEEMQKNMEKISANFKSNKSIFDDALEVDRTKK